MNQVYLGLGTNIGNRLENLTQVLEWIATDIGAIQEKSSIFETAAWGVENQANYYNQVIGLKTVLEPEALLNACQAIESKMGRIRDKRWGARVIDVDILFYNNANIQLPRLTVPHIQIQHRKFVLIPMAEIAESWEHPVLKKTIQELLLECVDELPVTRLKNEND